MTQTTMFEEPPAVPPVAPQPLRHTAQSACERIRDLLAIRPATSLELAAIDLNYTARVSELRQQGFDIAAVKTKDAVTGKATFVYRLEE